MQISWETLVLAVFLAVLTLQLFAEEIRYATKEDVPYRPSLNDEYAKERCVLDIYYPENVKGYATILLFHGGGLRGG